MSSPALSRATVDRDAATREDPAALAAAWERARVLVVDAGRVLADDRPGLLLVGPDEAPEGDRLYLGADADGPVFAVAGPLPRRLGTRPQDLRQLGPLLDDRDAGLLVHAVGLTNWHAAHPRCARCGAATEVVRGGSVRRCPEDGSEHFPRTDPAVIVLVHDGGDRCVLGHQPVWPAGRYSTLAGFVEPGESAEMAVVREVREEAGIDVRDVRYVGSQPWPFPRSLMVGFFARARSTRICVDINEIAHADWHTREGLQEKLASGELGLPGKSSIASRLIQTWLDGPTPLPPS